PRDRRPAARAVRDAAGRRDLAGRPGALSLPGRGRRRGRDAQLRLAARLGERAAADRRRRHAPDGLLQAAADPGAEAGLRHAGRRVREHLPGVQPDRVRRADRARRPVGPGGRADRRGRGAARPGARRGCVHGRHRRVRPGDQLPARPGLRHVRARARHHAAVARLRARAVRGQAADRRSLPGAHRRGQDPAVGLGRGRGGRRRPVRLGPDRARPRRSRRAHRRPGAGLAADAGPPADHVRPGRRPRRARPAGAGADPAVDAARRGDRQGTADVLQVRAAQRDADDRVPGRRARGGHPGVQRQDDRASVRRAAVHRHRGRLLHQLLRRRRHIALAHAGHAGRGPPRRPRAGVGVVPGHRPGRVPAHRGPHRGQRADLVLALGAGRRTRPGHRRGGPPGPDRGPVRERPRSRRRPRARARAQDPPGPGRPARRHCGAGRRPARRRHRHSRCGPALAGGPRRPGLGRVPVLAFGPAGAAAAGEPGPGDLRPGPRLGELRAWPVLRVSIAGADGVAHLKSVTRGSVAGDTAGAFWERRRKDVSLVYSRRAQRHSRRRPASRDLAARDLAGRLGLIVAAVSIPVLLIAYAVMAAHGERAVNTASVSAPDAGAEAGGWGRGGYEMKPGPAGSSAQRDAANAAAATSENWAGYVSDGGAGTFTSVSASWAQPAVTCTATNTFSSFWVGLDGDGTATVEQTGTEADCDGGTPSYQGWFEMFPNAPVFFDNPVQPGDAMSASVVAAGGGVFTLTLTDSTQGWTQTTSQTSDTAQLGSAEVIAEAPSDVTGATPSTLTGGGAFSVTWDGG